MAREKDRCKACKLQGQTLISHLTSLGKEGKKGQKEENEKGKRERLRAAKIDEHRALEYSALD